MSRLTLLTLCIGLCGLPALASTTAKSTSTAAGHECAMSYALFEYATPHVDLATCPEGMGHGDGAFCRASVANDMLHVYAFEAEGFQCLLEMRSFEPPEFDIQVH